MKTRTLACALLLGACGAVDAQDWNTGGNFISTTAQYLGCNALSTEPLRLKTEANQPIDWYTNAIQRMRLTPNVTSSMGPGDPFPGVQRNGFLLLSGQPAAFTDPDSRAPFTRLHLIDQQTGQLAYAQEQGFRPWMRNGVTFTGNSDQSYIGHKYGTTNDNTDFVVQWSDNPNGSPWGTDRMKFVFSTTYDPAADKGAATMSGMEAMRFWPKNNLEVNVGVGDFAPTGAGDPTERLDILDGRLRIRDLPDDPPANYLSKVLVVEDFPLLSGEKGVVKWRDISTITNADCDWVVQDANGYAPHISTAYNGSSCNWSGKDGVGIGVEIPKMKLMVFHDDMEYLDPTAIWGSSRFYVEDFLWTTGVFGQAWSSEQQVSSMHAFGVSGDAFGSKYCTGVQGIGRMDEYIEGQAETLIGVSGLAEAFNNASTCYGVYGKASCGSGSNQWAAWFDGRGFLLNGPWTYSDQELKTGVEEYSSSSGLEAIMALSTHRYQFNTAAFPHLGLPEEPQIGLIAQDLEEVLPHLVTAAHRPERLDSTGTVLEEALDFKAVNYTGLIPILIAAVQEQQGQLAQASATETELEDRLAAQEARADELAARLDQLEQALALCCASPDRSESPLEPEGDLKLDPATERLLRIDPNPFTDRTTIRYTLERGGRTMLLVNSSDGKQLEVLQEALLPAGEHRQEWHTDHLAPGVYYVTLLLDGEPLVKRAVKVN